ncbi:hypothetical protein T4D_5949 [Trichinella pseudospiralis]|uniref:Uncharacterized protein n=1 Tax=Trichinella pseudospiralis TaxID=6337 RepID=A0A0V1FBB9_TRIPS|nr:hypothetical protein T4D_5949 [Trichinella pseudospiralis]
MLLATAFLHVSQVDTDDSLLEASTTGLTKTENEMTNQKKIFRKSQFLALYYANSDRHNGALSSVMGHLIV